MVNPLSEVVPARVYQQDVKKEAGLILLVIYSSVRYRMAGRGSLAGLLAYGNANEIVMEMAKEVLPVV